VPTPKRIQAINRHIVTLNAIKNHQSIEKAQYEFTREMNRQNRAGILSEKIQFKPIDTRMGVSKKTHKINRNIIALTSLKNGVSIDEGQKEYTRKIQREYRARKLKEERKYPSRLTFCP
jgi:hypothetical protein